MQSIKLSQEQVMPEEEQYYQPPVMHGAVPELECFICKNSFDYVNRRPYLLPCSHTACKVCLQEFINSKTELECPFDGEIVKDFSSHLGGVKRHDDLLIALYVLEQQMMQGEMPSSNINLMSWQLP
jgi:zinc-RING finger domain